MMKTTNSPAGLELLSDEETFLNELVDEQDVLVNTDTDIEMGKTTSSISQQDMQPKIPVYIWKSKPKLWIQRTVNINDVS